LKYRQYVQSATVLTILIEKIKLPQDNLVLYGNK